MQTPNTPDTPKAQQPANPAALKNAALAAKRINLPADAQAMALEGVQPAIVQAPKAQNKVLAADAVEEQLPDEQLLAQGDMVEAVTEAALDAGGWNYADGVMLAQAASDITADVLIAPQAPTVGAAITASDVVATPLLWLGGTAAVGVAVAAKGGTSSGTETPQNTNHAPINTVPTAQAVNEDTALAISGISVDDVDGNLASTQISVLHGALTVSLTGGATISAGANGSGTLTLSGTQAQINAALATISYLGSANYNGSDTLTVLSSDSAGTPLTDSDTVAITVTAVNDAPVNTVPAAQTVNEDTALAISGISVNDVDGNLASTQISVLHGALTVNLAGGATISAGTNNSGTLTLSGTQAQINAALATLSYQGAANYNGADTLTVVSTDSAGTPLTDSDTVAITVTAVNDAPVNTVPTAQTVNEDTALAISGISVNDVDGNLASTQISVLHGALTVSLAGGATISAGANSSGTLTLNGTQAQINAALATISYLGSANYNGSDTLTVLSRDSAGTPLTDTDTVAITVTAVNDAPVNTVPAAQTVNEDTALVIGGISVNDVDGNLASTQISVLHGALTVSLAGGATISAGANSSGTLTLSGTQAQINAALATISYLGSANYNGSDTLTVLSTDSAGTPLTDSDTVAITVTAVNDAPVNTVPAAQTVNEDTALAISGISVNDVDGNLASTQISVLHGALTVSLAGGATISAGANSSGTLTLSGTQAQINAALATISYLGSANYNGSDNLTVLSRDSAGTPLTDSDTVGITVTAVNDAPVNTVPAAQTVNEDTALAISGISVNDVDGNLASTQISVMHGVLTVSLAGGATISAGANSSGTLTLSGTQTQINAALATISYLGTANYNGADTLTVLSTDSAGTPLTDSDTVAITVTAVNDAPVNTVPTAQTVNEDTALAISGISVNDVDGNLASTQVSVLHGALTVSLAGGATISAGANSSGTLTLSGTQAQINAALATISYQGVANYNGADTLTVLSRDSAGTPLTDSDTVGITVTAVNDAPVNTVPAAQTVNEDTALAISGISVNDVDGNLASTQVSVLHGALTVSLAGGATISAGANSSGTLTLSGTQTQINAALATISYQGVANYNGADTLTVLSADSAGTPLTDSDTVGITVTAVNDAPVNTVPTAQTVNEDTALAISGISVNDVDGNLASTQISVLHGALTVSLAGGATISAGANNSGTLTLSGTQAQINAALATISYQGVANYNGADTLTVLSTDSAGTPLTDSDTVAITVTAVNDAPVNTVPAAQTVNEDTALAISGISVNDVDGNLASTQISVLHGALTVSLAGGATVSAGANNSSTLTLSGTQAQINAALATISYLGSANYNGSDTLTVLSRDSAGTPLTDTDTVAITVTAVNDAPVNTVPTAQTVNEDTALAISGISVNDVDGNLASTQISVMHGALTVSLAGGATISAGANSSGTLTLSGTQTQINAALATLSYQGAANYNGADTLTVLSTDSAGTPLTDSDTVAITVTAVNDAPVNTVPTAQTVNEDTALAISGISVNDVDGNLASTQISVLHGALTVSLAGGATISAGANSSGTLTLSGTQAQINAALATLSYQGAANYNGADTLTVLSTDSAGTPLTDSDTVAITVTAVNDAPVNTVPTAQTVNEDTALVIGGISVNDVDGNLASTQVSVLHGALTVSLAGGATISAGANSSGTLTLSGTQAQINAALATISYLGTANYNGADTLTVLSRDSSGTPLTDSDTVAITVNSVNDAPTGTSSTVTMLQGGSKVFAASDFGFADPLDNPPDTLGLVQITTLPTAGTLTLNGTAVTVNQTIALASLSSGSLVYSPGGGGSGASYATIGFKVRDSGGLANGGVNLSSVYTLTFDVQSTAAPTAAVNAITSLSADSGDTTDFITNQASQTVSGTFTGTLALGETIQVSADGGTTWVNATTSGQTWTATGVTLGNGASQLITQTHSAGGANLAGLGHNYTLDTATTAPSFSLTTGTTLSGQSVINGTSEPGATVTVTIDPDNNAGTNNSFSYTATADGTGVWSVNLATALPSSGTASFGSGTAAVSAVQTDVAGNPSTATTTTYASSNATSYVVLGPTDAMGAQLLDANHVALGVDEGAGVIRFVVLRSGDTSSSGTVTYTTQNGTATAGSDYTAASGTVTFAAGETYKIITVNITDDATVEPNETFNLQLTAATGGNITTSTATVTINDNEQSVWSVASAGDVDEAAGFITYTVTRTGATGAATINFSTGGGTATAGSDYTAVAGQTLSFAAGETSKTVQVAITNDTVAEGNETVVANISSASTGVISTGTASAAILDNDQSNWSVASAGNVDEGSGFITYTITRTGASGAATIDFSTGGGTATAGVGKDYTALSQTLSFAAGEMSKTVQVVINNDNVAEGNETVVGTISNASAGTITVNTDTATILDNDQSTWSVASAGAVDEGAGFITYTVTRTGASGAASINFSTGGGTAAAGSDYTAVSQTLSFAAGEMSKTVQVAINDDNVAEANETVVGSISNATSGTIVAATASATINDNDQSNWSVASAGAVDEGAGFITYTITRTGTSGTASIDFSTGGGTATSGVGKDYTAVSQTLSFAAGEMSKTVQVAVNDDNVAEANETVVGTISNATSGNITTSTASATINDNDQSNWSVTSAGAVDEGAGFITYTVTRTGASGAASIDFSTGGGTATSGVGNDYTAVSQTLSFAAGEMSKTIQVAINDDNVAEANETVVGSISNATSGTIIANTDTATIRDNEQSIWSVASAGAVSESVGFLTFTVTRTGATGAASISFGTTGGTATGGVDYTPTSQTLNFAAGEMSKTVQVAVLNDALPEDVENVIVSLTNPSAGSIATATVTETILDDDQMNWSVVSAGDVDEGAGFITYVVSRTGLSSAATVQFSTAGGTATAGVDYTVAGQTLSFAAGEMSKTVRVAITDDNVAEGNETVVASISGFSQGNNTSNPAVATITDNDQSNWSVASAGTVDEGGGFITYTVTRTGASAAATIDFSTAGGSATAGVGKDYTAVNQTLNFAAGEMSKTIQVAINDDNVAEGNETVVGSISSASAGNITTNTASATINDNDQSLWSISSLGTLMDEGVGFITYIVSRTGSTGAASIDFATAGGTANPISDYTATNQTLSFAAGEMTKTVKVAIVDDNVAEDNETLGATISNATSGSIVTATTSASILDNDQSVWRVTTGGTGSAVDEGVGYIAYTVSRTGDASAAATITFATSGTATAGSDYTAANQTLTFAAGERSKVILVAVTDDNVAEGDETLNAVISNNSSGNIGVTLVGVTIQDNDQSNWSVASAGDVDEGSGFITYTVTRTGASAAASIDFSTAGGTATAGADYTAVAQTLNFAAGEMSKTVRVAVTDDALKEGNETVGVSISNATSGNINTGSATATINDNDQTLWSVNAAGIDEGAGYISYVITRTGDTSAAATIDFDTTDGSATSGVDYTPMHQTLSFAAGETTKTVLVAVTDDSQIEGSETLFATISNASSGNYLQATAIPTITDNDQSLWSVIAGGDPYSEGAGFIRYVVSRSGDASQAATISFSTVGGTAAAGTDYTPTNQTLSFAVGEKTKTVLVAITDDAVLEGNETVIGVIANASVGNIVNISGTATLQDNDQSVWSVSTADVSEGSGFITYTITRSGATTGTASIDFRTAGGTAAQGVDYTGASQTLTFAAGETTKTVLVAVTNDTLAEATNETVVGVISNATSGNIGTASASASITDNDINVWSVAGSGVVENANTMRFVVSRTDGSAAGTVDFLTTSSAAKAGADYTPVFSTLSFAVGETTKTILVPIVNDGLLEAAEGIQGFLVNPSSGVVQGSANSNITDNDATRVEFSIAVTTDNVAENAGFVAYTITRSGLTTGSNSVDWSVVAGGTATVGTDYTAASGTVTFAAGQTQKVVWVPLVNDATAEGNETLIVGLSNASKGAITTSTATANIVDDDTPASGNTYAVAAIANNSIESAGSIGYTITRSGDLTQTSTSYFRTNGGTAQTDGSDYVVNAGQTLNWAIGETTKVVFVQLTNDSTVESSETIIGQSATDSGYTAGLATATATVVDDDVTAAASTYAITATNTIQEGSGYTVFTITRSGDLTQASTSYFKTSDNTALAASDYTAIASQTLNWVAGETTKRVAVQLTNDSTAEGAELINGHSSALADFSVQTTVTSSIQDDDTWTATAGVNDTLTTQTASGTYTGGFIIDTADGNDAVTIGAATQFSFTNIQLGSGTDTLTTSTPARLLVAGAHFDGGSGVDTLAFTGTTAFDFIGSTGASTGDMFKNFEILNMSTAGTAQTINLSLSDVLEMTSGNAVADTIRITGSAGDILNLQALGKTLGTLAAGTGNLTDVDGTTYNVVASAAGNASANDVTIGGATYDVYQYNYDGHVMKLLVATAITTTVI